MEKTTSNAREKATQILVIIEDYLDENNVIIVNHERENEESAIIYGSHYYELEDQITEIIEEE